MAEGADLGKIWTGSKCSRTVFLLNRSGSEVELQLRTSCSCTVADPGPVILAPNERRGVGLEFHLNPLSLQKPQSGGSSFAVTIVPMIRGYEGESPRWQLTGTAENLFEPVTSFVRLGDDLIAGRPFVATTIPLVSTEPLRELQVTGGGTCAKLVTTRVSDKEYTLRIEPNADLPQGAFRFEVELAAQLATGETVSLDPFPVEGLVSTEIDASPRDLRWGVAAGGAIREGRIRIRSRMQKPFEIESIEADTEDSTVSVEKTDKQGATLLLQHRVTGTGPQKHSIKVRATHVDGTASDIVIPISYYAADTDD